METMKKSDFKLEFNQATESWMVVKTQDELTKNHKEIGEKIAGVMPENKSNLKNCPVRSYVMYNEHLNPENQFLWQVPLKKVNTETDVIWYGKNHIGKNPLAKFMSDVSVNCGLSQIYTNHCIRVTGASILTRLKFSSSEIMSVTGHKSVQSLAIYQKTQTKTKQEMGSIIGQAMNNKDDDIQRNTPARALPAPPLQPVQIQGNTPALPPPPPPPPQMMPQVVENKENSTSAIVPFNPNFDDDQQVPSFDISALINEVMNEGQQPPQAITNTQNTQNIQNIPRSLFHGCSIANITFNIKK